MKTIKYVGLASPWVDTLGGSGLTWTTNQVATVADDVANELLSYVTIFQFVANVPVGLPDLQAGFDSGTPAQQAQFQSSVSKYNDTRKLKYWFDGWGDTVRTLLMWGDSTTEQLAGTGLVTYTGGYLLSSIEPSLVGRISIKNHGANGMTLAQAMQPDSATNAGGNGVHIGDIETSVVALTNPGVCISLGINDARQATSIAGSTYGNAAQIALATTLRTQLQSACSRIVAANPKASIILREPSAHNPTSSGYLVNGVTGQNAMDVYRLTYRGDTALGLPPLDETVSNAVLFDTLRVVYNDTSATGSALIDTDGLHPSLVGYKRILQALLRLVSGPDVRELSSPATALAAQYYERTVGHSPIRPRTIADIKSSGDYYFVTDIGCVASASSYFDLGIGDQTVGWGAAQGAAYGSATSPAIGLGDIMVWEPTGLPAQIIPINNLPNAHSGGYLRWFGTGPDGYYPNTAVPSGTKGGLYRHKYAASDNARRNALRYAALGMYRLQAKPNMYNSSVTSASNGAITLRSLAGMPLTLMAHTMSTSDTLFLSGADDTEYLGIPLTGATFSNPDASSVTITLAGRDFSKANFKQAILASTT